MRSLMKRNVIYRYGVFVPAQICVLMTLPHCNAAAQSHITQQTTASKQLGKRTVQTKTDQVNGEKLVNVATIRVKDGSADKVRKTLKAVKIPVLVMGSRYYGVLVRQKDHDRALNILKVDARKQHYWIQLNR
ncbi:MAG: hypothetical protein JWL77_3084 [Chthonomonadaceae bacterium]|nr:hypothetical protein [Chthonomonadaceae bacterium]